MEVSFMSQHFQYFLEYLTKLFVVLSPLAVIALFASMTAPMSYREKIRTAQGGTAVAYFTALFFALTGQKIFEFLGITIGSFYIAGGTIIFAIGFSMLRAEDPDSSVSEEELKEAIKDQKKSKIDISITPFGIPIICGPGCITTTISLQSEASGFAQNLCGYLALTTVFGLLYFLLVISAKGTKWLTPTILKLSYRLSGLILAALAVEMVISGLRHETIGLLKPAHTVIQEVVTHPECEACMMPRS